MATVDLTADTFPQTVTDNDIVFVDFWAEWCGPCKSFGPIYERVSEEHPDIVFGKVDTESEQQLAAAFRIMSIPTLAVFREGIPLYMEPGMVPEAGLANLVEQVRGLDMDAVRRQIAEHEQEHARPAS